MSPDREKHPAAGFAVRRAPARSHRALLLRLGGGLLGVMMVLGAGWWLRTSPTFAVQTVESGSYRFTAQGELEQVFGSFLGRNIWTLSSEDVADTLATLPWVRDLQVHRRLPGALEVDFREWRPLLIMEPAGRAAEGLQVVVEDGRVLDFPAHLPPPSLPVLVGVPCHPDSSGRGRRLDPARITGVLELVAAIETVVLEAVSPVDFIVARPEGFAIVLQEDRGTLLVGRDEFVPRLDRFITARDHLDPGLQMDLRFADRITCRRI
jgi:hypothetical protein